jgi:serine/threonine-protein kinase
MKPSPSLSASKDGLPQFLHYLIRHSLGEGGFGQVFEAWDSKLHRSVAIKRLKNLHGATDATGTAGATHPDILLKEAQLAASLQHAAFVKIYALEDDHDSQSIVMELVHGQTLKQLLADAPPDARQALDIVLQVAQAMQAAHDADLVHGDLKPSNLMLEPSGAVRILDFGLAARGDATSTTSLLQIDPQGTIAYMAPERLLGAPLQRQSDIYALGVMLYEMLTGARPFANLSGLALAAVHMQSSSDSWPYPETVRPALIALVRAMTAHARAARLPTMQEVCRRIRALPDGAAPPAVTAPPRKQKRRALTAALLLSLLLLLAGGAWFAAPYAPYVLTLAAAIKPYSAALELRQGWDALTLWDRPGSLDDAERRFSTLLEHHPDNAAAVAGLSVVYSLRYQSDKQDEVWLQKATASAQQALQLDDQLALSHIAKGRVLIQQGKFEPALASYEQALSLDPGNIFAWYGKVDVLRYLQRYDAARKSAELGLQRYPQERIFADQIGTIYYTQGDYKQAEQAFRHSIALQPDAVFAYANLSAVLLRQNRPDEAMQALQQGLQIRHSAKLYGNLGNALFLRGDYVAAAAAFESAVSPVKGNPGDYLGWANLADTLLWIPGRATEARAAYARASRLLAPRVARAPNDVVMVSRMGLYAARTGDKIQCMTLMQRALRLAPDSPDVHFRAGLAYELIGDRKNALAAIADATRLGYPLTFIEAEPDLVALRRDTRYVYSAQR